VIAAEPLHGARALDELEVCAGGGEVFRIGGRAEDLLSGGADAREPGAPELDAVREERVFDD
jgi:hypothetical protein